MSYLMAQKWLLRYAFLHMRLEGIPGAPHQALDGLASVPRKLGAKREHPVSKFP
jgi:hypothetical protein